MTQRNVGGVHSTPLSHFRNQGSPSAARAQKPSGSSVASSISRRTVGLITSMTCTSSESERALHLKRCYPRPHLWSTACLGHATTAADDAHPQIGRASWRER